MMRAAVLFALLASTTAYTYSSLSLACDDGSESYAIFAASTARNALDTVVYGSLVGGQSQGCSLEITPTSDTFSIWTIIYAHQAILLLPNSGLSEEAMYHTLRINDASSEWYKAFVGGDGDRSNTNAISAIADMLCHARKARIASCETHPNAFACCSFMQYETWLRVAHILSVLIKERYGDQCGSPLATSSPAATLASFSNAFGALLDDVPQEGVEQVAARSRLATLSWAWRGVCDNRNGYCPPVNSTSPTSTLAAADAMSRQSRLALYTALVCVRDEER